MDTSFIKRDPFQLLLRVLGALLIVLLLLEGWRFIEKPSLKNKDAIIGGKLDETASLFMQEQQELLDQSLEVAQTLKSQIEQGHAQSRLLQTLQEPADIWGAGLFMTNQPVVWHGFSLDPFQEVRFSDRTDTYVAVQKEANVVYWQGHVSFEIQTEQGTIPYHLYTAKRIKQTNALPFADEQEFSITDRIVQDDFYTLNLSIYNPLPDQALPHRTLTILSGDSVGTVYATTDHYEASLEEWHSSNRFWRAVFALICFIVISGMLFIWVDNLPAWRSLLIQLFIIGMGWLVFEYIAISEYWVPTLFSNLRPGLVASYQSLCNFFIDGLFFLLAVLAIERKSRGHRFRLRPTWFLSAFFAAIFVGLLNAAGIIIVFRRCYLLAFNTDISLLTLQIFPGTATLVLYLALGIMLCALATLLLAINLFLLRSCRDQLKLVSSITVFGFIIGLISAQLFFLDGFSALWATVIFSVFFSMVFVLSVFLFHFPLSIRRSSPLRNAAIGSLILSIAGSALIYNAQMDAKDRELASVKASYSSIEDKQAEEMITDILQQLERRFRNLTEDDLQNRVSFIQTQFTQTVEATLNQRESLYSFDFQLIRPNSQLIADYSTDLNSPNWVNIFDLPRLMAVMNIQQINRNTVRPIVQNPELTDSENYQTFYRGWIPVFGESGDDPIAWILCSVYRERPNFNKPMQAVMASLGYRDWGRTFAIQQYDNRKLQQVYFQGVVDDYPVYNILQPQEVEALGRDSVVYYSSDEGNNTYRNLLARDPGGLTMKVSSQLPDYQNILFSFFRLSFALLISGFVFLIFYLFIKNRRVFILGRNDQFQYRILDSFLLATLVFLIILVLATHFAIRQQNRDLVQQELTEQLETITDATEQNPSIRNRLARGVAFSLDSLTTPLNVDASFYSDGILKKSTTPQIYQQHLLPSALPFPIYQDLFGSQKRNAVDNLILNGQDLLIGYRSILSEEGEPLAAIAIPTFVQSPKYDQQLLETTSYLIILYLVVFGLFILGTTIISQQLTRPLHYIRQGLNKISKGDLNTTIPVTSKDEIGSLAIAYNQMVNRLKELQEELAIAEREAAWQEMAQQVAHEIKNPLTPMKLNIQHLKRQLASGDYTKEELQQKIETITGNLIAQIQSLNNIASDFSKFSKPIKDEALEEVDINELVSSVGELYEHDDQVTITTACDASRASVLAVKDDIRRVIINLVKNAREAMPNGGTVSLHTYRNDGSIFIEVEDDGAGISEEDKPKIFVPNFSTKSSGTGLGLAICKKVIEAHDGNISFASIRGEGTTFIIKLPVHPHYREPVTS